MKKSLTFQRMVKVLRIKKEKTQIVAILEKGEEIKESLKKIAKKHNFYGFFFGIGAVANPVVGFFDKEEGEYIREEQEGEFEVLSLLGDISEAEDEPTVHGHIVLGDEKYRARGGHLVEAQVSVTLELFLFRTPKLIREQDEKTNLKLIRRIANFD